MGQFKHAPAKVRSPINVTDNKYASIIYYEKTHAFHCLYYISATENISMLVVRCERKDE